MNKNLPTFLMLAVLACISTAGPVHAGQVTGTILGIVTSGTAPNVHFRMSGTHSSPPACATAQNWFFIDPSTAQGKIAFAAVTTAHAMGQQVLIYGTGTCHPGQNNVEQMSQIRTAGAF